MKKSVTKRDFLKYALSGGIFAWIGAIIYPVISYLKPPKILGEEVRSVKVGLIDEFKPGSGTIFRFGNKPALLIRSAEGEFTAFEGTCTHLDCTVQYRDDLGMIWCACHNGRYDLNGRNVEGPPPKPLGSYKVTVKGEEVFASIE